MGANRDQSPGVAATVTLAKIYERQGLLDRAAEVYRKLLVLEPHRTELAKALEKIESRLGRQRQAAAESGKQPPLSRLQRFQQGLGGDKKRPRSRPLNQIRILVIHGSRADVFQGTDPVLSSDVTLEKIDGEIRETATACSMEVDTFQSDDEAELAQRIEKASEGYDAIIIDASGQTSKGGAVREALSGLDIPIIEVHLSCGHEKGKVGQKSLIADKVTAQLAGFGKKGYVMAVRAAANLTRKA
ncbi:MAG: type II 3-dehydroquinate dehydratase [Thermodesulfobacteriota bacterium]|nr:type II 3-dehydroquinate dehydratase [Thermodesulfobacteriota bacterium]